MNEIDFLPIEYRQKHAQRQSQPWQVVASVAIIGLVAMAALTQNHRRRRPAKRIGDHRVRRTRRP